ncbi:MAG: TetR/AcrR family transcriptional regulator [Pseudomonadota bacterium]
MSKSAITRQRIIETAATLFWSDSYHSVSVSEIAAGANVNKATLYQYFSSKQDLAVSVAKQQRAWALDEIFDQSFRDETGSFERLERIYRIVAKNHKSIKRRTGQSRGCPFVNSAMELAVSIPEVRHEIETTLKQFAEYYLKIIEPIARPDSTRTEHHSIAVRFQTVETL